MTHPANQPGGALRRPVLWIHGEALGPANPALQAHPGAPAVFVFDTALIAANQLSRKRLGFLYECLLELPVTIRLGDVAAEVLAFAARHRADSVITTAAVDPRFLPLQQTIAATLPVQVLPAPAFVALEPDSRGRSALGRFSRYWKRAEPLVWQDWARTDDGPGALQPGP